MTHTKVKKHDRTAGDKRLARDIRHQASDRVTRRFLRTLPAFKVVTDMPEHLRSLLDQLEDVEATAGGRERR